MDVRPDTPIKEIQSILRVQFAESVTCKNCQLARLGLQGGDLTAHRMSFELLPAYFQLLQTKAQRARLDLQICDRTGRFQRCFVCPYQSQLS